MPGTIGGLVAAIACLLSSAVAAAFGGRRVALVAGTAGALVSSAIGGVASLAALISGETASARMPWRVPIGELHVGVDPLSSFFLVAIFALSGLSAAYGAAYLADSDERRAVGPAVAAFNALVAAMVVVVLARDGILFLFAWELMSIASFLLVRFDSEREDVGRASFVYLAASHLGTAFLFFLFLVLGAPSGSYDFATFADAAARTPGLAGPCFVLAVVGFGAKAGLFPLHFWLPEAHPAAPSHVSALMSGVMIKIGVYGILRTLGFLGAPDAWWGTLLLTTGGASALFGILGTLGARDLKTLLAYSSIENVGVVAVGLGIAVTGLASERPSVASLGFAGALLHVWNHGLFKTVLFHAAGVVAHATHTRDLESLGGLFRRMPRTGWSFLAASISASALPPFNGFASEWLIYLAAFHAALGGGEGVAGAVVAIPLLALVGGLAAACFVRAFGIAFLGEPRSDAPANARDGSLLLAVPMWIGAAICLTAGVVPLLFLRLAFPVVASLVPGLTEMPEAAGLGPLGIAAGVLLASIAIGAVARMAVLRRREVRASVTWGCGYAAPSPRMQYTASSFAKPVLEPFSVLFRTRVEAVRPEGYFPASAHYDERAEDVAASAVAGLARGAAGALSRATLLQVGRIQTYLLYVFVTLIALFAWWMPR